MSDRQHAFASEPPELAEIWAALEDAEGVDARRVVLATKGDAVVLGGSVASLEEADRALEVVERTGVAIVNQLQVDPALREGAERPPETEQVEPVDPDEVLVGETDMLAGPDATITEDAGRALDENQPLEPPEEPLFR